MYGLLLDSIQKFLCEKYGERYWDAIRLRANLKNQWFVTHDVYSDGVLLELVEAAAAELGEDRGTVMRMFGEYFAQNIGHYGYARLLRVLGRDLRDFLNGLDDLHEYLRFSYPKMSPPSFFCESETEEGLILHYTTKRKGFLEYVIGQLTTVGRIYGKDLEIIVLSEENTETSVHIIMELKFDNRELLRQKQLQPTEKQFSRDIETFLGVFPFYILFDKSLQVRSQGVKLQEVLQDICGKHLEERFVIRKPTLETLSWKTICLHVNSVFELVSIASVNRRTHLPDIDYLVSPPQLRLKGQMMVLPQMEVIVFLCSPVMDSPEELYEMGIYVNDLAMHDSSRDIILAGSQKDPELNIALSQEKIRSAQLEKSIQQTDRLLFQMIPKPIANQLRNGETPLNTCREFSSVSILFSDIVSFTSMCSRLHPMEVVCVLNAMYVAFDELCEVHHVFKVETIGDAYMVICGAPVYTVHHAEYITDFGMAAIQATSKINDPSINKSLRIRVGVHSGNVVAGVVGSTVLRYDVFGDTVNVAARMEAAGEPMRVHISEATQKLLSRSSFNIQSRGSVEVKGKGHMNTYWVTHKIPESVDTSISRTSPTQSTPPFSPPPPPPPPTTTTLSKSAVSFPLIGMPPYHPLPLKPNEWPEAEHQLRKFSSFFEQRTTSPRGRKARRNTVADIPISNHRRQNHTQKHTHNRYTHSLSSDSQLWTQQEEEEEEEELSGCPFSMEIESELNPIHLRAGSFAFPTESGLVSGPRPNSELMEMERFAVQATQNAKQSQELANWAHCMVQKMKPEVPPNGTPVDPPQFTCPIGQDTHPEGQPMDGCPVDDPHSISSKCAIM